MPTGLSFHHHFSVHGVDPLDAVTYEKRDVAITNPDGTVVFSVKDIEVPAAWSQLATDIVASKYFRKRGLLLPDGSREGRETSVRQLVHRVAHTIRGAGEERGYFATAQDAGIFEAELSHLLVHQMGAFNSPVWFNCGLSHEYGITGRRGLWAWDAAKRCPVETPDAYARPQTSACFISSVKDDLMDIFELVKTEARLFNQGSGNGANFSALRSKYEKLSGGGRASGVMSFLEVYDRAAGATKSGGANRRAAKLVCLDMDHPEIEDFIGWKAREEKKAHILIAAGYPADFNGEAYHTIGGQHANNSVRVTDAFMHAVEHDGTWELTARTTGAVLKTVRARDLWRQIAEASWACADPGVQFHTTTNEWHTCPETGPIDASNPCGEYLHLSGSACNLASLNLTKFLREDRTFDVESYRAAVRVFFVAQEILVDFSAYPTAEFCQNAHDYRQLGLGYANLGALLLQLGLPYDSDEGRAWAASLTAILTGTAACVSVEMAACKGAFQGYVENAAPMLRVMGKHRDAANAIPAGFCPEYLRAVAYSTWCDVVLSGQRYGYRNAQFTVAAPTGTISFLMDCDTSGLEPDFALVKYKKLAGGGTLRIVNQSVVTSLRTLGYAPDTIRAMMGYALGVDGAPGHDTLEGAPGLLPQHLPVFDCAARCGDGTRSLSIDAHLLMVAAVQPFFSGGCSKTCNAPAETTVEEIEALHLRAWKLGLKSIALYRDGCKLSQPLSSGKGIVAPPPTTRRRLPKRREGFTQEARVGGHKLFLRTGNFEDGKLGEIFLDMHKEGASFRALMNSFAIAVSLGLQHGVPLEEFVEQFTFTRFEPQGVVEGHDRVRFATSLLDYVFRVLGVEYLGRDDLAQAPAVDAPSLTYNPTDLTPTSPAHAAHTSPQDGAPLCSECGHLMVRNASCYRCVHCGASAGCS